MTNRIQQTQEALVNANARQIEALKASLQVLQTQGLIKPFRISHFLTKEQEEEIEALRKQGTSQRAISAKTGVPKSTVARKVPHGAKKANKSNGKSAPRGNARKGDPIEELCGDCVTPQDQWQRSVANMAGDAVSLDAYWTRQFGDWQNFEIPSELVTLAKQAADMWNRLAEGFEKMKGKKP